MQIPQGNGIPLFEANRNFGQNIQQQAPQLDPNAVAQEDFAPQMARAQERQRAEQQMYNVGSQLFQRGVEIAEELSIFAGKRKNEQITFAAEGQDPTQEMNRLIKNAEIGVYRGRAQIDMGSLAESINTLADLEVALSAVDADYHEELINFSRDRIKENSLESVGLLGRAGFNQWFDQTVDQQKVSAMINAQARQTEINLRNLDENQNHFVENGDYSNALQAVEVATRSGLIGAQEALLREQQIMQEAPIMKAVNEVTTQLQNGNVAGAQQVADSIMEVERLPNPRDIRSGEVQYDGRAMTPAMKTQVQQRTDELVADYRRREHERVGRELGQVETELTERAFGPVFNLSYDNIDSLLDYDDPRANQMYQRYSDMIRSFNEAQNPDGSTNVANGLENRRNQLLEEFYWKPLREGKDARTIRTNMAMLMGSQYNNVEDQDGNTAVLFEPSEIADEYLGKLETRIDNFRQYDTGSQFREEMEDRLTQMVDDGDITIEQKVSALRTFSRNIADMGEQAGTSRGAQEAIAQASQNLMSIIVDSQVGLGDGENRNVSRFSFNPTLAADGNSSNFKSATRTLQAVESGNATGLRYDTDFSENLIGLSQVMATFFEKESPAIVENSERVYFRNNLPVFKADAVRMDALNIPNRDEYLRRETEDGNPVMYITYRTNPSGNSWLPAIRRQRPGSNPEWVYLRDVPEVGRALGFNIPYPTDPNANRGPTQEELRNPIGTGASQPVEDGQEISTPELETTPYRADPWNN